MEMEKLPVSRIAPEVLSSLQREGKCVLTAPPGAGKSTYIPGYLLEKLPLFREQKKKILLLEPRRLAARATAKRIAECWGLTLGKEVGCHTKFDHIGGNEVLLDVITEGVLPRMLQEDPALEDAGLIIFDEYHERHITGDLALALSVDVREGLNPDLMLLVMSATLEAEKVSRLLGDAPIVRSEGKLFPVEVEYRGGRAEGERLARYVCSNIEYALNTFPGDILIFLPGEGEIRESMQIFAKMFPDMEKYRLIPLPLYGNLPPEEQDKVMEKAPPPFRKVIFSTPIAETSLTIDGVRIIIDSGFVRKSVFSPASGMNSLETSRISLASAQQRKGRAGRLAPGVCLRLWHSAEERAFPAFDVPEILHTDLLALALELAAWGVKRENLSTMAFADMPPSAAFSQAWELLVEMGFLEKSSGNLTPLGRKGAELGLHPRLANMILHAGEKERPTAELLSALLEEKDFFYKSSDSDIFLRLAALTSSGASLNGVMLDKGVKERVRLIMKKDFRRDLSTLSLTDPAPLLAYAFPDRIGRRRGEGSGEYLLSNGTSARLVPGDEAIKSEYLIIPSAQGLSGVPSIRLSAPIEERDIPASLFSTVIECNWNGEKKCVESWEIKKLGSLSFRKKPLASHLEKIPAELRIAALLKGIRLHGWGSLPWSEKELNKMERLRFLHKAFGGAENKENPYPSLEEENLMGDLEEILTPFLTEKHVSFNALKEGGVLSSLLNALANYLSDYELEELAPERIQVPSGSRIRVDYSACPPRLSVKLQEIFGMMDSPIIAGGKVRVTMEILSPAMRPIQITSNLASFWESSYFLVRKEMRGRYPKHDWPENPREALPHRGVRAPKK